MESKRLEQEKMEEETLRGAFDETCCSVATRTGLSVDASGRGAPPKQQKRMGRAVLAPGARAFLQEGAIPLEGGLVRGRVRHAAEELKTELPELLEALQQGSAPCTESCGSLAENPVQCTESCEGGHVVNAESCEGGRQCGRSQGSRLQ